MAFESGLAGISGRCAADAVKDGFRKADCGLREGGGLMAAEYIWGQFSHGMGAISKWSAPRHTGPLKNIAISYYPLPINPNVQFPDGQFPFGPEYCG